MKKLYYNILNKGLATLIAFVIAVNCIPVVALAENDHAPDDYDYATSGVTVNGNDREDSESGNEAGDGVLLLESGDDESCICTAFCNDPDCPVCKDDYTQCFFYYCVCEVLCGEDDINADCLVCAEDYTNCVLAVAVPEVQPLADVNTYAYLQSAMSVAGTDTITLTGNITDGTSQLTVNGNKTLNLNDKNLTITVTSGNGIKIANGATLTIKGTTGKLTVINEATTNVTEGSGDGAGINTTDGMLIIQGGTIIAQGSGTGECGGAGIGGGDGGTYGIIEISGGNVTATGHDWGAGIGSGPYVIPDNSSSSITIKGNANIKAMGGFKGAGIGGGGETDGGNITIESSPTVVAEGGEGAAGIGGGSGSDSGGGHSGNIIISGGTVEATSGDSAGTQMAIGRGNGSSNNTITITGNYNYWTNTTQGSGTFTNDNSYKYVKLVEITGKAVTGVSLNKTSITLTVGDSETLIATVVPEDATDKSVTWSSNNESVATVNQSGGVTAVAGGTATITATTTDGGKTATCTVNVNRITPTVTTWPTVTAITYGQTLASLTLSGGEVSNGVAGSFAWAAPATVPNVGTASHSVTFTPSEPNKYNTVTGTVSVTVNKAPLTITGFSISKVYDGNNTVTGGFGTLLFSGLQNSETASVVSTGITATYNNATVGTGKAIAFSGSFGMTGGNANPSNYNITQPTGVTGAITAANQSALSITGLSGTYTYGDAAITLGTTGGSGTGSVSYVSNNTSVATVSGNTVTIVKAGNFTITATKAGDTNYNPVSVTSGSITVNARNISNVSIATIGNQTYTGSQITPTPIVNDGSITITASDYDVSYGTNVNTGTGVGSVTITGKGNYAETKTVYFNIVAAPLTGAPAITISDGTLKIGATLTVSTSGMTPNNGYTYQWNAGGTPVSGETNSTYIVKAGDVGKTITVTVTAAEGSNYTGTATSSATAVVPYTIIVNAYNSGGDSIAAQEVYQNAGTTVAIGYVLADTHIENKLTLSAGGTVVATTTTIGISSANYTVNASHATSGVITISAVFSHTSVLTTVDVSVTEPMTGAAPQTSLTGLPSYYGSHNVTWTPTISGSKFLGSTIYTVTVTLNVGAGTTTFDNSFAPKVNGEAAILGDIVQPIGLSSGYVTFSYTFDTTNARQVDSIAVTNDPTKTTYYSGDTLNMTGLVVTATYNDGTTGTVTTSDFKIDGAAVTSGTTVLTNAAHGGKKITVTYSGKTADTTTALTVNKLVVQLGTITGNTGADAVTLSTVQKDINETVSIGYILDSPAIVNSLTLGNGLAVITTPATSSVQYTVNAAHAVGGTITFNPVFSHVSTLTSANISVTAPVKAATPQNSIASDTYYDGAISWNGSPTVFYGDTVYSANITLAAQGGATFGSGFTPTVSGGTVNNVVVASGGGSVTFTVTFPRTPVKAVKTISITTQPQLVYVAGDKLDLSALVIKVDYDDTTTEDIAYNKSGVTYEINSKTVTSGSTIMANSAHNGKTVKVTYGSKDNDTAALTVYATPTLQISVAEITATSAKITYSVTQGSNAITSKLQVHNSSAWTDVTGASSPYSASSLAPNTSYEYRVWAQDNTTSRVYTSSVTFRTSEASAPAGITVEGDVKDTTSSDIFVSLEHGNTVISSVKATATGTSDIYHFSFSNVPNGVYNLVVDNGSWKVTQAVTIVNGAVTNPIGGITIDMSTGRTQSVVDIVTPDTPPAAVGGLPELFGDTTGTIFTPADQNLVNNLNGTVEIKLAVEKKDNPPDAGLIAGAASGQSIGLYLDLSVIKSQFDSTGALLDETKLTDLNGNLLTITFELPSSMSGKTVTAIYRAHNDGSGMNVDTLTKTSSPEYFEQDGDIITLYVYKFSTYALAYTPQNTNPSNPPSSGGGSSGGSSGSGTGSTVVSTYWIEVPEAKTMAKAAKEQGAALARSRRTTITGIRKASLAVLADADLRYQHDTVEGNAVQVRIYVDDPAKATKDILVSGYVKGDTVDKTATIFGKWFPNRVAVISLDQQGDFGIKVQIAAKVDLSGIDTSNLYFYSYDKATNKYKRILTEYRIDSKGYLHFATVLAGNIIISDRPLSKTDAVEDDFEQPLTIADLQNPNTGGDGIGMFVPPTQAQPQTYGTADILTEAATSDGGVLKLEEVDTQSTDRVLLIDLDAHLTQDALADSLKRDKISVYWVMGITSVLLLAAMTLWAVIPRKNDPLVPVKDFRKKH